MVVVEDGQEAALSGDERRLFDTLLPLNNKQVVPASQAPKDETVVCGVRSCVRAFVWRRGASVTPTRLFCGCLLSFPEKDGEGTLLRILVLLCCLFD